MVLCKFFQQGNCRNGQNCRFAHVYGSKYSYHSNAPQAASTTADVTDEQLITQVHSDVQSVLRGGQWLLSSYAPFKEKPAFPGIADLSPEEIRLLIYEAKANNNVDQAVAYTNNLFNDARSRYEQLLLKNTNITEVLRCLSKGENVASPFRNVSQEDYLGNNPASSVFRSAVQTSPFAQNNQQSIFGQNNLTPSVFGQSNTSPSIFAQNNTNSDPAKSIFAQANQNPFTNQTPSPNMFAVQSPSNINSQSNLFGQQTDSAAKSLFAQATQNVFAPNATQSESMFTNASQTMFGQNQQGTPFPQSQSNIFQKPENQNVGFNQNTVQQANAGDMNVYSKMEELSAEDLDAFKSNDFKMGFVPEVPPPHALCF